MPIILLTALDGLEECIGSLELGADDDMVKPFSPKELEARIRSVLRRCSTTNNGATGTPAPRSTPVLEVGDLRIDARHRPVHRGGGERIRLSGMEFNMLELLLDRAGEPVSRGELLDKIWGSGPNAPPTSVWWTSTSRGYGPRWGGCPRRSGTVFDRPWDGLPVPPPSGSQPYRSASLSSAGSCR